MTGVGFRCTRFFAPRAESMPFSDIATPAAFAATCETVNNSDGTTTFKWLPAEHLLLIDRYICDAIYDPSAPSILVIEVPPRHGKSELCSKYLPAWYLGMHPDKYVMLACHGANFAELWGRRARAIIREHGHMFGVSVSEDRGSASDWETNHGGGMKTAGIGGDIMGRSANILIIDDYLKNPADAYSPTIREKQWEWLHGAALRRMEPGACAIVLAQRWHKDDLIGRLLAAQDEGGLPVRRIQLPAVAKHNDPLGREPGAALWPERFPINSTTDRAGRRLLGLNQIRSSMPRHLWASQYQQEPTDLEDLVFHPDNLSWYVKKGEMIAAQDRVGKTIEARDQRERGKVDRFATIDTAGTSDDKMREKRTGSESWSVCQIWEHWRDYDWFFLRSIWRKRVGWSQLRAEITEYLNEWQPYSVYIEKAHWGVPLSKELNRPGMVHLITPIGDKLARSVNFQSAMEDGRVFVPRQKTSWFDAWYAEVFDWTGRTDELDDQVDCGSHAINAKSTSKMTWGGVVNDVQGTRPARSVRQGLKPNMSNFS